MSAEELDLIVDSSAESGHLTVQQAALLERAINFSELEASDAMVPWNRVVTIGIDETADDLRELMGSNHSRFPVIDGDGSLEGIVHAKDLLGVPRDGYGEVKVARPPPRGARGARGGGPGGRACPSCAPDRPRWRS